MLSLPQVDDRATPTNGHYGALRRRLTITVLLVSLTPLLAVTIVAGSQYNASYQTKVRAHLEELVQKHEQNINGYLDEKLADVLILADVLERSEHLGEQQLIALHQTLLTRHGSDFVDLGLVDADGILRAYSGPFKLGAADYSDAVWFAEVKQRKFYVSDVFLGLRNVPHFIVAVVLHVGEEEWILRTTLDFVAFNELVADIHVDGTGRAFIINGEGEFQTTPDSALLAELPFLLDLLGPRAASWPRGATPGGMRTGAVSVFVDRNPATGLDTIFVTTPLKYGEWTLVFQQNVADAYADLERTRTLALLVVLAGGLAIVLMAVLLPGRLVKRIERADLDSSRMSEQVIEAGKLASIGELAAGIAHEINNPVAIMVQEAGWIRDLMEGGQDGDDEQKEIRRALSQIEVQGARCRDITHNLLRFSRKVSSNIEKLQVNEMLEDLVALSEKRARFAKVSIETDLDDALPPIAANPSEMQQILLNLVNNAIDAMEKAGGVLRVSSRTEKDVIVVSISDTGMGIPKANLARIFDPFFTTKSVGKGTGLGLSVTYGIIDRLGGEISVSSVVDEGTTFAIRLPSGRPSETGSGPDEARQQPDAADARPPNAGAAVHTDEHTE